MQVFSVSAFLHYLNDTFKAIWDVDAALVEGEVSGYKVSQGQWATFDLKDEQSVVNVFMPIWKLGLPIEDGMRVRVVGMPRLYAKYGKFSLNAERVEPVGEGGLRKALALLRQKLQAEGLFDAARKRSLPRFPKKIALIASRESAAYGDFLRILHERWPGLEIHVYHVLVQGEKAAASIIDALDLIASAPESSYDVVVITRGGGSFEELLAFQDEALVRAIYACPVPTLVGIGHERDFSLAEEVADVRGSTPTDCARRLVPDQKDILYELASMQDGIILTFDQWFAGWRMRVDRAWMQSTHWMEGLQRVMDQLSDRVQDRARLWVSRLQDRLIGLERMFVAVDPMQVMKRGFVMVKDREGRVWTSASALKDGDEVTLTWADGQKSATIGERSKPYTPSLF